MKILPGLTIKVTDRASGTFRSCHGDQTGEPTGPDDCGWPTVHARHETSRCLVGEALCARSAFAAPGSYRRYQQGLRRACHGKPPVEGLRTQGRKRKEAMREHRLSRTPDSEQLVQVTASYVTLEIHSLLPLLPLIWQVRIIGTGR